MKKVLHTLIIDDHPDLLFSLQEYMIDNFRVTITLATSGEDAISILEKGNLFDLIISDFNMPNGDGSTVFNFVQSLKEPIPFIFHSASMAAEDFSGRNFLGTVAKGDRINLKKLITEYKFEEGRQNMDKIIDGVLTVAYLLIFTMGSGYTAQKALVWTRNIALEKAATGLGSLESASRKMTGGKLDY